MQGTRLIRIKGATKRLTLLKAYLVHCLQPTPTYGSVHHASAGRRHLGKVIAALNDAQAFALSPLSLSPKRRLLLQGSPAGPHADALPPLPPSSRATHAPQHHPHHHHHHHHHHHRSNVSVCVLPPAVSRYCVASTDSLVSRRWALSVFLFVNDKWWRAHCANLVTHLCFFVMKCYLLCFTKKGFSLRGLKLLLC